MVLEEALDGGRRGEWKRKNILGERKRGASSCVCLCLCCDSVRVCASVYVA